MTPMTFGGKDTAMMMQRQFMLASEFMQQRLGEYRRARDEAQAKVEWYEEFGTLMNGLRTSWRDQDPGKYGPHVFFMRDLALADDRAAGGLRIVRSCKKVWVPDLLDDARAAREGLKSRYPAVNGPGGAERIPVPLAGLAEVRLGSCGGCRLNAPLVGTYRQTFDGPDGDEWRLDVCTVCIGCPKITPFGVKIAEYRFM